MVLRNVAKSFSLEQQRLEINALASDVHALAQGAVAPTTYTISSVDGAGADNKIIRLTGSDSSQGDIVLFAGTGLQITRSNNELTLQNIAVETDPVYSASAAANITNTKISNWDTAYGWGDHSTQGYATTSDLNTAVANSSNWDTAYGWGDHSTSGYLTSVALNDITDVDTTGVTTGQALIWNAPSSTWIAGTVASSGGGIALTDITVTSLSPGTASLVYDNTSGVFSYTPPDLSGYSTFSGSYNDLTNKPTFSVSDLTDVNSTSPSIGQILKWDGTEWSPAADLTSTGTGIALSDLSVNVLSAGTADLSYNSTSGVFSYTPPDLSGYSTFSGSYTDLTNQPTLFSGSYTDLTNQPTLFSESYNDLTDKPTLFSGSYTDLTDKPTLFSESYNDLTDKPTLFSGSYVDLTNKPTIPSSLNDLIDVLISGTPNDGAVLKYNGANSRWELGADQNSGTSSGSSGGGGNVAVGSIMMWSGAIADIPTGWQLCDGSGNSPDLRDRFVIGSGSTYPVGDTGGSKDSSLPSHSHTWSGSGTSNGTTNSQLSNHSHNVSGSGSTNNTGSHDHRWGANTWAVQSGSNADALDNPQGNGGGNKSADTSDAGSHSHNVSVTGSTNSSNLSHSHNVSVNVSLSGNTGSEGISAVGTNLPPYYSLCFIYCTTASGGSGSSGNPIELDDLSVNVLSAGTADLSYNNTTGLFSYTPPDLSGYSTFSGSYNDLTDKPTLFSGSYNDLTNQPTLFSGSYNDLTNIPAAYTNSDVDSHLNVTSSPTNGHVLSWNGSDYAWVAQSSGGSSSGTTYQWADGVVASGWIASDLSDEMFDGNLTSWSKAETTNADYLGWDNSANGANLPILNGPVEIFVRYADTANYSYEVNGVSVSPDVSGAVGSTGGWVTLTSGTAGSFKVSTSNTGLNISISGVKSNGLLLTPTAVYGGSSGSGGTESDTLDTVLSRGATTTRDINTTGKVYFANVFSTTGDLPSASSYHGMFAHVHASGKGYFAHAGAWIPLANESQIANATEWDAAYGWGDHAQAGYSTDNYSQQLIGGSTSVQLNFISTPVSGGASGTTSIVMNAGNNITFSNVSSAGFTIDSAGGSGSGTVTQIDTGTGISGGPITSSGTIELADTGVTAGTYTNPDQITVNGQGQITSLTQGGGASIPNGIIVMWSGSASSIPSGWALCNGQTVGSSTTPDLRGMFIVGSGGTYSTGDTGGSESVVLTTSDLPSHTHTISAHTHNIGNHGHSVDSHSHNIGNHTHSVGDHWHNFSGSATGNTGNTAVPHTHAITGTVGTGSGLALGTNYTGDYSPRNTGAATDTTHSHSVNVSISGQTNQGGPGETGGSSGSTGTSSPGTNQASGVIDDGGSGDTGSTGNGTAHENRPPYYALAYIMKV
ncbi:MAG: hypothetical protein CMO44_16715 [Verrucomicrobiales bacterium]|nr:hypothetical protein [Verrucomicrobiales bacterium]